MPDVSPEEVLRLAALARIRVTPEEAELLAGDLAGILAHVERLQEAGAAPVTHAAPERNVFREDADGARIGERSRDVFPESQDGFLVVPRVF